MAKQPKQPKTKPPELSPAGTVRFRDMALEDLISIQRLEDVHRAEQGGNCARCQLPYRTGDWIFRDLGVMVGVNCCATSEDIPSWTGDPIPMGEERALGGDEDDDFVALSTVLPTGRSKADMCRQCFQIPSNNGVCGC